MIGMVGLSRARLGWPLGLALAASAASAGAQITTVDPDAAFDGGGSSAAPGVPAVPATPAEHRPAPAIPAEPARAVPAPGFTLDAPPAATAAPAVAAGPGSPSTYRKEDLVNAAQGAFGKGARDVALAIGDILKKQGEPNGYIVGNEGGGAFIVGLRYGSGTLHQKTAPPRPVYWSGPSVGFDAGAAGGNTFVLVYNLADQETLFTRFGAGEGQAYVIGGMNVGYLRSGNLVLIPVRMGVGLRLGVNAGYMKFSRRQNWVPF